LLTVPGWAKYICAYVIEPGGRNVGIERGPRAGKQLVHISNGDAEVVRGIARRELRIGCVAIREFLERAQQSIVSGAAELFFMLVVEAAGRYRQ
jgi:hypothetical protein